MEWLYEDLHDNFRQGLRIDRKLYEGETKFQKVQIFENEWFGRILVLDGIIQTTELDEFIYHEIIAHVPLFSIENPRRVLIVGGGDGGCLEEVLKHPIDLAIMCELDEDIVKLSQKYLPSISKEAFSDPRTKLIFADAGHYLEKCKESFDVIIVDSTDPVGPGEVLYSQKFYANCKRCLTNKGILVTQNGVLFLQSDEMESTRLHFEKLFAYPQFYFAAIPTYAGGLMAFGCASTGTDARNLDLSLLNRRFEALEIDTRYYNPFVHKAAFVAPAFLSRLGKFREQVGKD